MRADKILASHFTDYSRSQIQQAFRDNNVRINNISISQKQKVFSGDTILIVLPSPKISTLVPVPVDLDVLFEDEHLVAINKNPGIVVHPGSGTSEDTLVHGLLHHTNGNLCSAAGESRPGVVHRLDKETSGVILFAKSSQAYFGLIKLFSERNIRKKYLALVQGILQLDSRFHQTTHRSQSYRTCQNGHHAYRQAFSHRLGCRETP